MNTLFWLVVAGLAATIGAMVWLARRNSEAQKRAEEARVAAFVSGLAPVAKSVKSTPVPEPVPPVINNDIALQKLLFEAAHKAGAAGEPALAIQLYARLLSRYPATSFAEPARAAAAALKKKLVKA